MKRMLDRFALGSFLGSILASGCAGPPPALPSPPSSSPEGAGGAAVASKAIRLWNGRNLDGWTTYTRQTQKENPGLFTAQKGLLRIAGGLREEGVYGSILTRESYQDYRLLLEYRWGEKSWGDRAQAARSSGLLLHCVGSPEGSIWPPSIEVAIMEGATGDLWLVSNRDESDGIDDGGKPVQLALTAEAEKRNGEWYYTPGTPAAAITGRQSHLLWVNQDPAWKDVRGFRGKDDVESPLGQWTTVECLARGGELSVYVNGRLVNRATDCTLRRGRIGLQSEAAEIFFRRVELTPLE
jgi:hypothetical protein